jgi:flavin-dependent thymidylate synthase
MIKASQSDKAVITATYIDHMGSDLSVVNAARVSFGKKSEWANQTDVDENYYGPDSAIQPILSEKDAKLIKYLAKHKHLSPFGHSFVSFHVKAPIFVARQLVKHKFLRINEVSRRYVTSEPEFYVPNVWRKMAENVKQGSSREQLLLEGVKVCKYCHTELDFLRKEDEKMKTFCSAGCQGSFYRKYTDKGWATAKHSSLRESALKRGIHFDLTVQDIIEVGRPKFCKYLEVELDYASTKVAPNSPSVNRINPSVGYVKGNLEVISNKANSMLLNATKEELKVFMKNVSLTQFGVFTETANSVDSFYGEMKQLYKRLVDGGMCAEQARMFMPTSQMTEFYWSGSLDAFADMCRLRLKEDTQYETRLVARQISVIMEGLFPVSWEALLED